MESNAYFDKQEEKTMDLLYEADTEVDFETYMAYNKSVAKLSHRTEALIIICVLCFLASVVSLFRGNFERFSFFLMLGMLYPSLNVLLKNQMLKSAWDSNKTLQGHKTHYLFYEDHMEMSGEFGNSSYKYSDLYKIIEGKTVFCFMTANNLGHVLNKTNCSDELMEFIRSLEGSVIR